MMGDLSKRLRAEALEAEFEYGGTKRHRLLYEAAEALEWQPIADAPRDGTPIFVWKKGVPVVRATIWRVRPNLQPEWEVHIVREAMPGVPDAFPVVTRLGDANAPTHFMHVPEPPEGE